MYGDYPHVSGSSRYFGFDPTDWQLNHPGYFSCILDAKMLETLFECLETDFKLMKELFGALYWEDDEIGKCLEILNTQCTFQVTSLQQLFYDLMQL